MTGAFHLGWVLGWGLPLGTIQQGETQEGKVEPDLGQCQRAHEPQINWGSNASSRDAATS